MSTPRTVIVTGSAGLIGSETVRRFAGEGARVIGIFRRGSFHEKNARRFDCKCFRLRASRPGYSRHCRCDGAIQAAPQLNRRDCAYRVATVTRLGRSRSANRFYRQRQRHAESFGSRQTVFSGGAVYFYFDEQGLWRHAESFAPARTEQTLGNRAGPRIRAWHR